MADFSAKDVQALRQATGAGMMDAKKALTETGKSFRTPLLTDVFAALGTTKSAKNHKMW